MLLQEKHRHAGDGGKNESGSLQQESGGSTFWHCRATSPTGAAAVAVAARSRLAGTSRRGRVRDECLGGDLLATGLDSLGATAGHAGPDRLGCSGSVVPADLHDDHGHDHLRGLVVEGQVGRIDDGPVQMVDGAAISLHVPRVDDVAVLVGDGLRVEAVLVRVRRRGLRVRVVERVGRRVRGIAAADDLAAGASQVRLWVFGMLKKSLGEHGDAVLTDGREARAIVFLAVDGGITGESVEGPKEQGIVGRVQAFELAIIQNELLDDVDHGTGTGTGVRRPDGEVDVGQVVAPRVVGVGGSGQVGAVGIVGRNARIGGGNATGSVGLERGLDKILGEVGLLDASKACADGKVTTWRAIRLLGVCQRECGGEGEEGASEGHDWDS